MFPIIGEVVIRTNSYDTVLTVNAPRDTVKHFDKANKVEIISVDGNSYHEYGDIQGNISLASGRVVTESGSKASAIKVTATAADITSGIVTISVDNTSAPTVAVVVPETVKNAIETKGGDNNKITASEESIITDAAVFETMSKFAGGIGTKVNPYLISTSTQLNALSNTTGLYAKLINDIVNFSPVSNAKDLSFDGGNHKISFDERYDSQTAINGNSHCLFTKLTGNIKISDLKVESSKSTLYTVLSFPNADTLEFDNVDTISKTTNSIHVEMTNASPYLIDAPANWWDDCSEKMENVIFRNCDNSVSIINQSNCASVFLNWGGWCKDHSSITFENCSNSGNIQANSGAGLVTGHLYAYQWGTNYANYTVDEVKSIIKKLEITNTGTIKAKYVGCFSDADRNGADYIDGLNSLYSGDKSNFISNTELTGTYSVQFANGKFSISKLKVMIISMF